MVDCVFDTGQRGKLLSNRDPKDFRVGYQDRFVRGNGHNEAVIFGQKWILEPSIPTFSGRF